jgi:hypothetical protein
MAFGAGGTISPVLNSNVGTYCAHGAQGGVAYAEKYYASPTAGATYPIVIAGSGGNTTFNSTVVLTSSSNITTLNGGTGGTASGGDFNANGGSGGASINHSLNIPCNSYQDGNGGGSGAGGSRYGNGGNGATATGYSGSASGPNYYNGGGLGGVAGSGMFTGANNTVSSTTLASGISSLISVIDDYTLNYPVNNANAGTGAYVSKVFPDLIYQWPVLPIIVGRYGGSGNILSNPTAGPSISIQGRIYIIEFYA